MTALKLVPDVLAHHLPIKETTNGKLYDNFALIP